MAGPGSAVSASRSAGAVALGFMLLAALGSCQEETGSSAGVDPEPPAAAVESPDSSGSAHLSVELVRGAPAEFVWIDAGSFTMGTTHEQEQLLRERDAWEEYFENEQPAHRVTITEGFYLGRSEVTQAQWEAVTGRKPWLGRDNVVDDPTRPAVHVSWRDVQTFVGRLNASAGEVLYRLPTEAEWEYACRSGGGGLWSFGDESADLGEYAWYMGNARGDGELAAQPVGTRQADPRGLFDMCGNVHEWVQDWSVAYGSEDQVDPTGPPSGDDRVLRGGSVGSSTYHARSALRFRADPYAKRGTYGVRLVRMR